jgi:hypothetical protein
LKSSIGIEIASQVLGTLKQLMLLLNIFKLLITKAAASEWKRAIAISEKLSSTMWQVLTTCSIVGLILSGLSFHQSTKHPTKLAYEVDMSMSAEGIHHEQRGTNVQERVLPLYTAGVVSGEPIIQEEPVRAFRTSLNVLGDGFVEATANGTLHAIHLHPLDKYAYLNHTRSEADLLSSSYLDEAIRLLNKRDDLTLARSRTLALARRETFSLTDSVSSEEAFLLFSYWSKATASAEVNESQDPSTSFVILAHEYAQLLDSGKVKNDDASASIKPDLRTLVSSLSTASKGPVDFYDKPHFNYGGSLPSPQFAYYQRKQEALSISTPLIIRNDSTAIATQLPLDNPFRIKRFVPNLPVMVQTTTPDDNDFQKTLMFWASLFGMIVTAVSSLATILFTWISLHRKRAEEILLRLQIQRQQLELEQLRIEIERAQWEQRKPGIVLVTS